MRFSAFCFLAAAVLLFSAGGALALTPTDDDLSSYQREVQAFENEINAFFKQQARGRSSGGEELKVFEKSISVRKKSSSITRALRRAKDALKAQAQAWINSIAAQGYAPVEKPEPITKLDHKWGMSGLKFYVRLKLYAKIWCVKLPSN